MSLSGNLEKWTNYWLGWQTRFFILDRGILSYYQNEEEVEAGAKASIKVTACDIIPDSIDPLKLDLTVGSGQKFSIRAPTTALRQTWLIALGVAKQETDKSVLATKNSGDKADKLARKSTELRLYCDLLVQQVETIQQSATVPEPGEEESPSLNENAMMLSATCKTFLKTLKDTMALINDNIKDERNSGSTDNTPVSPILKRVSRLRRTPSTTSLPIGLGQNQDEKTKSSHKRSSSNSTQFSIGSLDLCPPPETNGETKSVASLMITEHDDDDTELVSGGDDHDDAFADANSEIETTTTVVPTFFTQMQYSFVGVQVTQDSRGNVRIPTESFLNASGDFLPILDKLGSKAFQPVKMDISGNIAKIRTKFDTDRDKFNTLQAIVLEEKSTNTNRSANSATDAIMWLKRGLTFVKEFLKNVAQGEQDLTKALQDAYTTSLARHHGWVVRGVFHLAVKAAPYYNDFIEALLDGSSDEDTIATLMSSMTSYTNALERILDILDEFYRENQLESSKLI